MNNCLQSTIGDIKVNKALFPCSRSLLSVTWETSFSAKCYIKAWNEYHGYAPKEMNSSFNVLLTWGMRTQKWVHRGWSWGVGGRQSKAPSWGTSQAMRREFEFDLLKVLSKGVTSSQLCLRIQLPEDRREAGWCLFSWKVEDRFCDSPAPSIIIVHVDWMSREFCIH